MSEGAAGGAAVVHDCFRIMIGLLSRNASNRRFFRESGALLRVPPLLLLPPSHTKTDATTVTPNPNSSPNPNPNPNPGPNQPARPRPARCRA